LLTAFPRLLLRLQWSEAISETTLSETICSIVPLFQSADGFYHPEDEVHLPWFMRLAPNNVSEPTQSPSTNVGRYTFMGDLNPFPGFRQPATDCN
jgi:hypothetical protein